LRFENGIRIIDPEFCFLGTPAFDVGFMTGHLYMADQPAELIDRFFSLYRDKAGGTSSEFFTLARQFAGCEIMRRLIGVAQLPLTCGLEKKEQLLELSRDLVLSG
jgi:5-methylthioribose kinase